MEKLTSLENLISASIGRILPHKTWKSQSKLWDVCRIAGRLYLLNGSFVSFILTVFYTYTYFLGAFVYISSFEITHQVDSYILLLSDNCSYALIDDFVGGWFDWDITINRWLLYVIYFYLHAGHSFQETVCG